MILIDNKVQLDKYAKAYASKTANNSLKNLAFQKLPALFKKYNTGNNVLDFGCGAGYSSVYLKSIGLDVVGVDINPNMIKHAKSEDPDGVYTHINGANIPFDDNKFDLVFASYVLLEISSLDEIQKVLNEISRVLKVGGHFVAVLANENTYKYKWNALNTDFPQNKNLQSGSKVKIEFIGQNFAIEDYYWSREDYLSAMNNASLNLLEISEPIADPDDEIDWKDELHTAPCSIYFMQKK